MHTVRSSSRLSRGGSASGHAGIPVPPGPDSSLGPGTPPGLGTPQYQAPPWTDTRLWKHNKETIKSIEKKIQDYLLSLPDCRFYESEENENISLAVKKLCVYFEESVRQIKLSDVRKKFPAGNWHFIDFLTKV